MPIAAISCWTAAVKSFITYSSNLDSSVVPLNSKGSNPKLLLRMEYGVWTWKSHFLHTEPWLLSMIVLLIQNVESICGLSNYSTIKLFKKDELHVKACQRTRIWEFSCKDFLIYVVQKKKHNRRPRHRSRLLCLLYTTHKEGECQ